MPTSLSFEIVALVLFIGCLASHSLVLLNDGVYWDGWAIQGIYRQDDLKTMKRLTHQGGLIFYYYIHNAMSKLPKPIFFFKLFSFVCLFLSSILVFYICRLTGILTDIDALCISLLMLTYPGNNMTVEPCVILYTFHLPVFFLACWLGFSAESAIGLTQIIFRIGAVILFLISFNFNSLLVYYGGFLVLLLLPHMAKSDSVVWNGLSFIIDRWYFIILPLIYWLWKEIFTPRHGYYKTYNKIGLRFKGLRKLPKAYWQLLKASAGGIYLESFQLIFKGIIGKSFLVLLGLAFVLIPADLIEFSALNARRCNLLIVFGVGLLICASIPYILVGQNFGRCGWESKNNLLLPVPMALIIYGILQLVFPEKPAFFFTGVVVLASISLLNKNYLLILAVYVKNRSILENLKDIPDAKNYSVFGVLDRHRIRFPTIGQPEHRSAYLVYMFEWLWGKVKWFGINETKIRKTPYTRKEIDQQMVSTGLDEVLKSVDPNGPQAMIIVESGQKPINESKLAMAYIYNRLFRKVYLESLFSSLTRLTLIPLAKSWPDEKQ